MFFVRASAVLVVSLVVASVFGGCSDDTTTQPNPPRQWKRVTPVPAELPDLYSVASHENDAIAVDGGGFVMGVENDDDWTTRISGASENFVASASANGLALCASDDGTIYAFGPSFIEVESFDARWRAACAFLPESGAGILVVGDEGKALVTQDGRTFQEFTLPTEADLTSCSRWNVTLVSDEDGYVWSGGGDMWMQATGALTGGIRSVWRSRTGQIAAVGSDGALYRWNSDEDSWEQTLSAENGQFRSVNDGYAVGDGGLLVKGDGVIWTRIDLGTTADLRAVDQERFGRTVWVVGFGGTCFRSEDTVTFERRPVARPLTLGAIHWTGDTYVVGGWRGGILLSESGNTWRRPAGPFPTDVRAIAGNGSRVVATSPGAAFTSDDLDTWVEHHVVPTGVTIREVVWTGDRYVGWYDTGLTSDLAWSESGEGFRPVDVDVAAAITAIASFDGDVVIAGSLAEMFVLDANDELGPRPAPGVVVRDFAVQGDYLYAVGRNEIWRTDDLEAWLRVFTGDVLDGFVSISNGRGLVAITARNLVFESDDGVTWTQRGVDTTHRLQDAAWGLSGWVLVGSEGAIYVE